jgi:hypothetical protein
MQSNPPPNRPLDAKFILPALTEATDSYWRPIKYSLFPPLGLATLAAYLTADAPSPHPSPQSNLPHPC